MPNNELINSSRSSMPPFGPLQTYWVPHIIRPGIPVELCHNLLRGYEPGGEYCRGHQTHHNPKPNARNWPKVPSISSAMELVPKPWEYPWPLQICQRLRILATRGLGQCLVHRWVLYWDWKGSRPWMGMEAFWGGLGTGMSRYWIQKPWDIDDLGCHACR